MSANPSGDINDQSKLPHTKLKAKYAHIRCSRCGVKVTGADVYLTEDSYFQQIRVDVYDTYIYACLNKGDLPRARRPLACSSLAIFNLCCPIFCDCIENEDLPEYLFVITFPKCRHYYNDKSDRFNKDDNVFDVFDIKEDCTHNQMSMMPLNSNGKDDMSVLPHSIEYRVEFPMLFLTEENKWTTKYVDGNTQERHVWNISYLNVKPAR